MFFVRPEIVHAVNGLPDDGRTPLPAIVASWFVLGTVLPVVNKGPLGFEEQYSPVS